MKAIKSIRQITSKRGDLGYSENYSRDKLSKDDLLFNVVGDIDELSSQLGVAYHYNLEYQDMIKSIQGLLQNCNSVIATSKGEYPDLVSIGDLEHIESMQKMLLEQKEIKPVFIKPGSDTSKEKSYIDLSRAICRRSERQLVRYIRNTDRDDLSIVLKIINRLSDLLFIMAR